jgi:hypothetical protein
MSHRNHRNHRNHGNISQTKTKKTPLRDRRSFERKAPSVISLLENELSDILLPNVATICVGSCRSKEKPRSFHSLKNKIIKNIARP